MATFEFPAVEGEEWSEKVVSDGGAAAGVDAYMDEDGHSTWFVVVLGWFISYGAWLISRLGGLLYATSTTELDIATVDGAGTASLDVGAGKAFGEGQHVTIHKFGDTTKLIFGVVAAYTDAGLGPLVVDVEFTTGAGTFANWVVRGSGPRGPQGIPGDDGADGMTAIVEDETPQLGGDLDVNSFGLVSVANGHIPIQPHGTGSVLPGKTNFQDAMVSRPELKDYAETVNAIGNTGAACTVDLELGNVAAATLNGNCTFTFSNPPAAGKMGSFILILTNDATPGRTTTWPASVKWIGGTQPSRSTDAGDVNIYSFFTIDGGATWYGNLAIRDPS